MEWYQWIFVGAYIRLDDYPDLDASVVLEDDAYRRLYSRNTERQRNRLFQVYKSCSIWADTTYKSHGYTLAKQEWAE